MTNCFIFLFFLVSQRIATSNINLIPFNCSVLNRSNWHWHCYLLYPHMLRVLFRMAFTHLFRCTLMTTPGTPGIHLFWFVLTQPFLCPRFAFTMFIVTFSPVEIFPVNVHYILIHCKQMEHQVSLGTALWYIPHELRRLNTFFCTVLD